MPKTPPPTATQEARKQAQEIERRFEAIERALAALTAEPAKAARTARTAPKATAGDASADTYWALNGLQTADKAAGIERGSVLYTGDITLPSGARYAWQKQLSTDALLSTDWLGLAGVVTALGHPVRLRILRHCLGHERSTQELLELDGMGTTGQLFHHLKTLQAAGWLRSLQRGHYQIPGERAVPLLAVLSACAG